MKKFFSLLALMLLCSIGASADVPFRNHRYDTFKSTPINENSIVFVGNSITNMHPWVEAFGNDPRIVNRGCSGGTSAEILANVRSYCVGHPAKIFLMIGINDNATTSAKQAELANNIMNTVSQIRTISPNTMIYVQSILPCGRSGWPDAETVATCNTVIQELLTQNYGSDDHVMYLDVYSELLGKLNTDNTGAYSFDKLHTTAAGYAIWTNFIKSYVDINPVYPSEELTKARQNNGGSGDSWGARATYFSMFPIESDDVLFFGDEMVHGGEWQELLGNPHVKNRGTSWGYEATNGWMSYTKNDVKATFATVEGVSKVAPKQVLLYTGTGEVNGTGAMSTLVDYYKGIVTDIRNYTNASTKISLVSLMPTTTSGNARVKEFNAAIKAYADATDNVEYIDIYSVLATNDNVNTTYFPASNNYLYGEGYVAVANELAQHIDNSTPVSHEQAKAYRALIEGENADEAFFEEGYYRIQVGEGTAQQHADYKGYYMYSNPHTHNGFNWAIGLTQDESVESTLVYISGSHDLWHIQFNHGKADAHYTNGNTTYSTSASSLCLIPNSDASEWKIKNAENNQYWIGWNLSGPSVGAGTADDPTSAGANCYYKFIKYVEEPTEPEEELTGFTGYKPVRVEAAKEGYFVIDARDQNSEDNHHFLYSTGTTFGTATTIDAANYDNYVWHVTANANGTYYFKNVGTGKYITIGGSISMTDTPYEVHFDFGTTDNAVYGALGTGSNKWFDCGNAGTSNTTWADGVTGSRRMRIFEAEQTPTTYTLQCKKNSKYATYNENANDTDGNHLAGTEATTPGKQQKIIIESAENGFFTMRIATEPGKYVYAINTSDANSNIGVCELASGETGTEEKYLWNIKQNTAGYYNIIPKGGSNGWNVRGTVNGVGVIGQWSSNATEDNRWQFVETGPYVAQFPDKGTYYVTFNGTTTDRKNWLYNDLTQSDGYTIQAQNKGEGNEFIWKVVNDGTRITSLVNGQGQNGIRGRRGTSNYYYTEQLEYEAYGAGFYLKPYNATNMDANHNCINVASNNNYKNAAGLECVTSWNTTNGAGKADNIWQVLNVTDKDFYEVVIIDGVVKNEYDYSIASYVTYNGQKAANGGFFALAKGTTITETDLAAVNSPTGKTAVFSVEGNVIRVNYVEPTPINVTYTFTVDGKEIGSVVRQETTNSAPTITDIIPEYVNVVDGMPTKVTEGAYTIETSYKDELGFVPGKKYVIWFKNGSNYYYWHYDGSGVGNEIRRNGANCEITTREELDNYGLAANWRVGGDWLNGFTFLNCASQLTLTAPDNLVADTAFLLDDAEATRFTPVKQSTGRYRFYIKGQDVFYLAHTSHSSHRIAMYNVSTYSVGDATGGASVCMFEEVAGPDLDALQEEIDGLITNRHIGAVGYPTWNCTESQNLLNNYCTNFLGEGAVGKVTDANYDAALTALNAFYATTNVVMPEDGKAYRIHAVHVNTDGTLKNDYVVYSNEDGKITASATGASQTYSIFVAKQVGGNNIVLVNELGNYLNWCDSFDANKSYDKKGSVDTYNSTFNDLKFEHANKGSFSLSDRQLFGCFQISGHPKNNTAVYQYFCFDNGNNQSFVSGNPGDKYYNDNGRHTFLFMLEEVENPNIVKLTNPNPAGNSSLDGKFVGTFSAPYNVELTNGVKAYTGVLAADGSAVVFTLLGEDGTIVPKNTGVLVYAESATDAINDFAIPAATAAIPVIADGTNIFLPTGRTGATLNEGDLVLGKGNNGVGFYKINPAKNVVARNKAYIPATALTASVGRYVFDFDVDGSLTGINGFEVTPAAGEVYDLQGRRVQKAQKGLYIINGKKVVR